MSLKKKEAKQLAVTSIKDLASALKGDSLKGITTESHPMSHLPELVLPKTPESVSKVESLLNNQVQKEITSIRDEQKANAAKEGSQKVIEQQINKVDEVEHEYESQESKKLSLQHAETSHKMGKEEINILDQAVMTSFKKHLNEVEVTKAKDQKKQEEEAEQSRKA